MPGLLQRLVDVEHEVAAMGEVVVLHPHPVALGLQDVGDLLRQGGHGAAAADEKVVRVRVRRRAHGAAAPPRLAGGGKSGPMVTTPNSVRIATAELSH